MTAKAKENFTAPVEMLDLCLNKNGPHTLSCGFGWRDAIPSAGTTAGNHPGIDVALPIGTKILAPFNGQVTATRNQLAYGRDVFVYNEALNLTFFAGHLSQQTVKSGQNVTLGSLLGYSGNTGQSTGPHLHAGLYKGKVTLVNRDDPKWIDPVGVTFEAKKTNEALAAEVWNGDWGNGPERKKRLTEAGYDYAAIQAIVNLGVSSNMNESSSKPVANDVGKKWTPKKTPLTLYADTGIAYSQPSNTVRSYTILAENAAKGLVQISHTLFSPNKVWVKKSDGVIK